MGIQNRKINNQLHTGVTLSNTKNTFIQTIEYPISANPLIVQFVPDTVGDWKTICKHRGATGGNGVISLHVMPSGSICIYHRDNFTGTNSSGIYGYSASYLQSRGITIEAGKLYTILFNVASSGSSTYENRTPYLVVNGEQLTNDTATSGTTYESTNLGNVLTPYYYTVGSKDNLSAGNNFTVLFTLSFAFSANNIISRWATLNKLLHNGGRSVNIKEYIRNYKNIFSEYLLVNYSVHPFFIESKTNAITGNVWLDQLRWVQYRDKDYSNKLIVTGKTIKTYTDAYTKSNALTDFLYEGCMYNLTDRSLTGAFVRSDVGSDMPSNWSGKTVNISGNKQGGTTSSTTAISTVTNVISNSFMGHTQSPSGYDDFTFGLASNQNQVYLYSARKAAIRLSGSYTILDFRAYSNATMSVLDLGGVTFPGGVGSAFWVQGCALNRTFPINTAIKSRSINISNNGVSEANMNATMDSAIDNQAELEGPEILKTWTLGGTNAAITNTGRADRISLMLQLVEDKNIILHTNVSYYRINSISLVAGTLTDIIVTLNGSPNWTANGTVNASVTNTTQYNGVWTIISRGTDSAATNGTSGVYYKLRLVGFDHTGKTSETGVVSLA